MSEGGLAQGQDRENLCAKPSHDKREKREATPLSWLSAIYCR